MEVLNDWKILGYDVLVVDDGSESDLREICEKFGVYYIKLGKNYGKGYALKEGFKWGMLRGYKLFATVDGDGQHKAEHFKKFLDAIKSFDIVIGSRRGEISRMDLPRKLSNRITSSFISIMTGKRVEDSQCGYRLIKREVLERIKLKRNKYDLESELLVKGIWMGFKVGFVPISVVKSKKSYINPIRDIFLAMSLALELILLKS